MEKGVGTIAGYFYFDDDKFTRVDFLNENLLMKGLMRGRFDVILLERETAKYWANLNNADNEFAALHSSGHLLMRVRKQHKQLIPLLNKTISDIKLSGKLAAILARHGVDSKID